MAAPGGELVMQIPTGQDGIHIEGIAPEMLPWGPMAFTISGTGQVWIADTAADRLMCFEMSGQSCGALELQGQVEGIGDLEVAGEKIWLLDMATSPAPTLLQVTLDGTVLEKRQLPPGLRLEDGLSGLWLGEAGELLVEREGGALLDEVVTASGQETQMPWEGYLSQGRTVVAVPAEERLARAENLFARGLVAEAREALSALYDRRITLEVCLTSNLQTNPQLRRLEEHAFSKLRAQRLSTTICTDNRLVSNTTVTNELLLACTHLGLDRHDLKSIIVYGFKRSFFPGSYLRKRQYVRQIIDYYDRIEARHPAGS